MVRFLLIAAVAGLLFFGCKTIYIQKDFFDKYTEILKDTSQQHIPFKINGAYVTKFKVKSFLNPLDTIEYFDYSFFYANHLVCNITIPLQIRGKLILNEDSIINAIKEGTINDRLGWSYFEIKNKKVLFYGLDEWYENPIIFGYTLPLTFREEIILNDTTLLPVNKSFSKKRFIGIKWKEKTLGITKNKSEQFKIFELKPDSSKSSFTKMYNIYLRTNSLNYRVLKEGKIR